MPAKGKSGLVLAPTSIDSRPTPAPRRVLLVEDEEAHARIIQRSFARHPKPFELTIASSLSEAFQAIAATSFDVIISDWRLPDGEGIELLTGKLPCPVLFMTSHGNENIAVQAMRAGALDYIVKSENSLLDMAGTADGAIREAELRIAEERLQKRQKEEEWFRLVVEATPSAMILTRSDGLINLVNTQTERLFGYVRLPQDMASGGR